MGLFPSIEWAIAGIVLIGVELLFSGLVAFFFGVGALITALMVALLGGLRGNFATQILLWVGASGLSLFVLRPYLRKILKGLRNSGGAEKVSGRSVEVIERITTGRPGRVRIDGTSWRAVSWSGCFEVNDIVEIVREENLTVEVTKSYVEEAIRLTDPSQQTNKQ